MPVELNNLLCMSLFLWVKVLQSYNNRVHAYSPQWVEGWWENSSIIPLLMKWWNEVFESPLQAISPGPILGRKHQEQHAGLRWSHWLPLHPNYFIRQSKLPGIWNAPVQQLRSCEALTLMRALSWLILYYFLSGQQWVCSNGQVGAEVNLVPRRAMFWTVPGALVLFIGRRHLQYLEHSLLSPLLLASLLIFATISCAHDLSQQLTGASSSKRVHLG